MSGRTWLAIGLGYGAAVWFTGVVVWRWRQLRAARTWTKTRGAVLRSEEYRDGNRTHFRIMYAFDVGERHVGDTPRLCGGWFWSRQAQQQFVARFPQDAEVDVYYDPRDPRRNCLDRDDRTGLTAMLVIAGGGAVLATMLVLLRAHR